MSSSLSGEDGRTIWTVGHSTRSFDEFLALLQANRIEFLADVRHFPTSQRAPWAKKAALAPALGARGIGYEHFDALGGFRKAAPDSVNTVVVPPASASESASKRRTTCTPTPRCAPPR